MFFCKHQPTHKPLQWRRKEKRKITENLKLKESGDFKAKAYNYIKNILNTTQQKPQQQQQQLKGKLQFETIQQQQQQQ